VGLIADLVRSAQGAPARYATGVALGPHFTALAAAPRNGGGAGGGADAGGVAYTGAGTGAAPYDAAAATAAVVEGLGGPPSGAGQRLPGIRPVSWRA
jgi:hypothetical protein